MKISVVIPAYNEEKYIGDCIDAVHKNSDGKLHEVIVVDNASTDSTSIVVARYANVVLLHEPRKGTSHARQTGFEHATGDIVCFLDADTRMQAGWITQVIETFSECADVVSLSGPYHYFDAPRSWRWILGAFWWLSAPVSYWLVGYMILIGNVAIRKSALVAAGGFDRKILFYGDDTDIARRLSTVGKTLWRMNFYIYSSARRFRAEGIIMTNMRYALNFIWPVLFNRPYTLEHKDIR